MIWIVVAVAAGVVALGALIVLAVRVRAYRLTSPDDQPFDDVDPLFTTGIAIAGSSVALAVTIGPFMYAMFIVGMIVMALGAYRTRKAPKAE